MESSPESVLKGFAPIPTQIYLDKQPSVMLFSKPKIMPIKSPNLIMLEKMQKAAQNLESKIEIF